MSDKPIAVGDLVVIVKTGPCGCTQSLGHIHTVSDNKSGPTTRCIYCSAQRLSSIDAVMLCGDFSVSASRLKRIPPLDELEGVKSQEQTKEPA